MADGKTVFKYGCFGCVGLLALAAVALAVLIGVAKMQAGNIELAEQAISPELPQPSFDLPEPGSVSLASDQVEGRIELDLSGTGFLIEPAEEGESLHVDAAYDKASYVFEESLTISDDGPWVYRFSFRRTGSGLFTGIKEIFSNKKPKVTIFIPADRPVALDIKVSQGGVTIDLGGLWITEADIDMEMGGGVLTVAEPMRAPMNRLRASASMGGFVARRLGNGSPRVLDIDTSMGGMDLDLRGRWANDSDIGIRVSMGGADIRLPSGVRFQGLEQTGMAVRDDMEIPPPTLNFDIQGDTDKINFWYP